MAKLSDTVKCGCSSDFIPAVDRDILFSHSYTTTHQYVTHGPYDSQCPKCEYYFYIDPNYENMLYDLRSMNTIW